jgi:hypothetical protein
VRRRGKSGWVAYRLRKAQKPAAPTPIMLRTGIEPGLLGGLESLIVEEELGMR